MFVNSYIYFFILAFWDRSVPALAQMLMAILVGKQIALNLVEYVSYRYIVGGKIKKEVALFDKRIQAETCPIEKRKLKLCQNIESQLMMQKESEYLIWDYQE